MSAWPLEVIVNVCTINRKQERSLSHIQHFVLARPPHLVIHGELLSGATCVDFLLGFDSPVYCMMLFCNRAEQCRQGCALALGALCRVLTLCYHLSCGGCQHSVLCGDFGRQPWAELHGNVALLAAECFSWATVY